MSSSTPEPRPPREDEAEAVAELLLEHAERLANIYGKDLG